MTASSIHQTSLVTELAAGDAIAEVPVPAVGKQGRFGWWEPVVQIFGLAGVAVAQPLFALLGENPTYFVAHRARPLEIVVFALVLVLVPALVLIVPVLVLRLVSPRVGRLAAALVVGGLASMIVLAALDAVGGWRLRFYAVGFVVGAALVAWLYMRFRAVRLFALYLGAAPLLFVVLFLFTSGVQPLVFGNDDPAVLAAQRSEAPVVVLVFDELPLGALLRADGTINSDRFPGFAELAQLSTWYPHATTVATYTQSAVPAILTGRIPDALVPPVAFQYPRSLFTMLGSSRQFHVVEQVTSLCPRSLCEGSQDTVERGSFTRDTTIVGLHQVLPAALADRWLPSVTGSWTNFGQELESVAPPQDDADLDFAEWQSELRSDDRQTLGFTQFLDSLTDESAGLWYYHATVPHMPWHFLPDGRSYVGPTPLSRDDEGWWADGESATVNAQQRLLLQVSYADTYVSAILERLRASAMLDQSLLVVLSDHGIDVRPGMQRRGSGGDATAAGDAVLPVPLFIKYPGQLSAAVDQGDTQTIDVLPTIADVVGTNLPADWSFDGRSLAAESPEPSRPARWLRGGRLEETVRQPDPLLVSRGLEEMFGAFRGAHDLYAVGPHWKLVGDPVVAAEPPIADATVVNRTEESFTDVDLGEQAVPALFVGQVEGVASDAWVAVAIDGTVAGLGPVFTDVSGQSVVEIMIDPNELNDGRNDVALFQVDESSGRLHRLNGP